MLHVLKVSKTPLEAVLQPYVQYRSVHNRANSLSSGALGYKIFQSCVDNKMAACLLHFLSKTDSWSEVLTSALTIQGYWVVTLWVMVIDISEDCAEDEDS